MKRLICVAAMIAPVIVSAQVIVNDSWSSGTRTSPPNDAGWWTSTGNTAIEVGTGYLGLVTGSSGRGIHGIFATQTLGIGDTLTATFTFTTPSTVGTAKSSAFRIGLFDPTGKPGLAADLSASSGTPNHIYDGVPGYMMDFDVNTGTDNITFREHNLLATSGQLMAQTTDYNSLSQGGGVYSFAANTTYTGVMALTRTGTDTLDLTGSLLQGATLLSTYTGTDASGIVNNIGMVAFHVNSGVFGSSATPGTADNGIDFSNIKIELTTVPEPSVLALLGLAAPLAYIMRREKRR